MCHLHENFIGSFVLPTYCNLKSQANVACILGNDAIPTGTVKRPEKGDIFDYDEQIS